jgi:hypothetical protein
VKKLSVWGSAPTAKKGRRYATVSEWLHIYNHYLQYEKEI